MNEAAPAPTHAERKSFSRFRQMLAWGVHLYTGLGLVLAAGMAGLIVRADGHDFAWVFVLMLVAVLVDATDGTLARAVRVKDVLPGFDGTLLDNLIDFLTYTFLPLFLLWRADIVPDSLAWNLLPPLLASAYGFCQTDAKTADGYFRGFPSYWNIVALYLYVLHPPINVTLGVLWLLALLTFVPSVYLYPSRGKGRIDILANVLAAPWLVTLIWILVELTTRPIPKTAEWKATPWLVVLSLSYPLFYLAASWIINLRRWKTKIVP